MVVLTCLHIMETLCNIVIYGSLKRYPYGLLIYFVEKGRHTIYYFIADRNNTKLRLKKEQTKKNRQNKKMLSDISDIFRKTKFISRWFLTYSNMAKVKE